MYKCRKSQIALGRGRVIDVDKQRKGETAGEDGTVTSQLCREIGRRYKEDQTGQERRRERGGSLSGREGRREGWGQTVCPCSGMSSSPTHQASFVCDRKTKNDQGSSVKPS